MELNQAFLEYIEAFKSLNISEKRSEVVRCVNEMSAVLVHLAEQDGKNLEFLKSRETTELQNGMESEDDFLEALVVYVENAKNLLAQYLDNKI